MTVKTTNQIKLFLWIQIYVKKMVRFMMLLPHEQHNIKQNGTGSQMEAIQAETPLCSERTDCFAK